jgi:arylsulfatase A-like enzyme
MTPLVLLALLACGTPEAPPPEAPPERTRADKSERTRADKPERAKADRARNDKADRSKGVDVGPNVIVLVWDTVRADMMGIYDDRLATTPRMSVWAEKGVVYERAVSPGVWTLPSHASLFTGLPVREHGVSSERTHLDDRFVTFAEILGAAGYDTFAWSSNPFVAKSTNLLQGFDEVAHPWSKSWKERALAMQERKAVEETSTSRQDVSNPWALSNVGGLAEQALEDWLDARGRPKRPFLAFVNLMEAHATRRPVIAARKAVMDEQIVAASRRLDRRVAKQNAFMAGKETFTEADLAVIRQTYQASVFELDKITGDLLDTLEARGALDDTLIVLTADHGELLGEHGMMGHQFAVWNALSRVPMVVIHPGRLDPGRIDTPHSTSDLYRIILEHTGVEVPKAGRRGLDNEQHAHGAVTEYTEPMASSLETVRKHTDDTARFEESWLAVEHGPHKLLVGSASGEVLYRVASDPSETAPVSDAAVVAELRAKLDAWSGERAPYDPAKGDDLDASEGPSGRTDALRALGYVE